jgi:hypothetical protein
LAGLTHSSWEIQLSIAAAIDKCQAKIASFARRFTDFLIAVWLYPRVDNCQLIEAKTAIELFK